MPNSLKVMIKKLAHKGRISSLECDELLMKLDGHDLKVRADERAKVLHEQRALDVNLQMSAEEVRADERAKTIEEIGFKLCSEVHFGYEVEARVVEVLEQMKGVQNNE